MLRHNDRNCAICGRKIDVYNEVYYSIELQELMPEKQGGEYTNHDVLAIETLACLCKKCVIIKNMFNAYMATDEAKKG